MYTLLYTNIPELGFYVAFKVSMYKHNLLLPKGVCGWQWYDSQLDA